MAEEKCEMLTVATKAYTDQKPGTSGLRKKVVVFQQENYLHNFIQSTFDSLPADQLKGCTMVVSGDGRYWNKEASMIIIRMAAANGLSKIIAGKDFLMSTPNVSSVIRSRKAYGGIILTASHNPGGPKEDFGVKYNCTNGGPAPEKITAAIFAKSKVITEYKIAKAEPKLDITKPGITKFGDLEIEIIDAAKDYVALMKTIFDFEKLKKFAARKDFTVLFDSMHGVAGPFAREIFITELGLPESSLQNCVPKEDFDGGHPDPNLTYAHDLVENMGLGEHPSKLGEIPEFGAAADGDADRNMILGKAFFVTPSDSVAIIAANAVAAIPFFKDGLKGVARSMPTSGALDRVAKKFELTLYEVPTGWKFFGNLMDDEKLSICGEESFGTGSDHIREKDGIWAVLAWMSILQIKNDESSESKLVSVEDIVTKHWAEYGRNYYSRYDYENVDADGAKNLMANLVKLTEKVKDDEKSQALFGEFQVDIADEFSYTDPVDKSVSEHQGIRFIFTDGSRIIFRLSGTGSVGATIRLYVEKYDSKDLTQETQVAIKSLIDIALVISKMEEMTGRKKPTVIT